MECSIRVERPSSKQNKGYKKKYERLLQQGLGLGKLTQAQLPSTLCCQAFMKLVFELRKHHALGKPFAIDLSWGRALEDEQFVLQPCLSLRQGRR